MARTGSNQKVRTPNTWKQALEIAKKSTDDTKREEAIETLKGIQKNIRAQIAQGKKETNASKLALEKIDELLSASTVSVTEYRITQMHYDVEINVIASGPLDAVFDEVGQRLHDYVNQVDATADLTIGLKGGQAENKVTSKGPKIGVLCKDTITADEIFKMIAPNLVALYDLMDSDYESDVEEFLMDI